MHEAAYAFDFIAYSIYFPSFCNATPHSPVSHARLSIEYVIFRLLKNDMRLYNDDDEKQACNCAFLYEDI